MSDVECMLKALAMRARGLGKGSDGVCLQMHGPMGKLSDRERTAEIR
jgi:hypothetical protein